MKYMTLHTKGRLKTNGSRFAKTKSASFSKPYQSGMTLIEVLVAMFVLAIGVLALACYPIAYRFQRTRSGRTDYRISTYPKFG